MSTPHGRLSSLSLIMPAHNESENLRWLLPHVNEVLPRLFEKFDVIIVDDGSTDGTGDVARAIAKELGMDLKVIRHEHKSGYGAAVGDGLRAADMDYTAFTDSDGQLDVADLDKLVPLLDSADMVGGWRMTREDPAFRSVISGTFNRLVLLTLDIKVRDVNCALKIIKTPLLKRMKLNSRSALINAEMYWKTQRLGGRYVQVGVPHHPRTMGVRSGGRLIPILRASKELMQIRFRRD
ncbi:MAG TPA: glycosyltransferase family 2 protein [Candidatus Dormibacteraeota bacterium]|nr:glycosyltransferase family 2 protein [Candidatus Dormibacteraeota bacterium]